MGDILTKKRNFTVAVDEVDYREILKPGAILQYFQDIATAHAKDLGIGYEEMKEKNLAWIVTKISYVFFANPAIDDKIVVKTYPKKPRAFEATRDYYIENENGGVLIKGSSKWCLIDFLSHSIKRCDTVFSYDDNQYNKDEPLNDCCPKIPSLNSLNEKPRKVYDYTVRITDLDRNLHMNNARYGDAVLNAFSTDELEKNTVFSFDINFISELKAGDMFTLHRADQDGYIFFEADKNDGTVIFRARVKLKTI